ncbi:hypothetical protein [Mycolicibacterium porcinum]|uniref:hypothetical protein n=1 Tax=Mycolicibacterium porcinum TaxID=39693 RepID=UPI0008495C01|nr:hypothetical protein [Mycolicibacterium porcinum]ODR23057.1 hypothetical protein BHQ19_18355 [Mycolicibacterium porcinum]
MSTSTRTRTTARKNVAETPAPAKDLDAKAPEKQAEAVTYRATATGRGGKTNSRKVGTVPAAFAVDVADEDAKSPAGKAGLIWSFHATKEQAEAQAAKWNAKPALEAVVVEADSAPIS